MYLLPDSQSGLPEPNQGEPNRTVPNIGRTEQRSGSFLGEHEPRRTVAPNVRFVDVRFGSPWFGIMLCHEPYRTDICGSFKKPNTNRTWGLFGSVRQLDEHKPRRTSPQMFGSVRFGTASPLCQASGRAWTGCGRPRFRTL